MTKFFRFYLLIIFCLFSLFCKAMVYDNRFFPLYLKYPIKRPCLYNHFQIQPFFMKAEKAQGEIDKISIPDLDGRYNLIEISKALQLSGRVEEDPLRSDLSSLTSIPFSRDGNIDGQGISFFYEYPINSCLSFGTSFLFMHVNSRHEFCLDSSFLDIGMGQRQLIFNSKEKLHQDLGVVPPLFSKTFFGDIDCYLRYGYYVPYTFKFRAIDFGFKVGALIPTSPEVSINNPASVPIGGERHWGLYFALENQYELREDWFVQLMFRASKRFKRTSIKRMPVLFEPSKYGSIVGSFERDPGWTFVFSPSFTLEGIREGLGVSVWYTLVGHLKDKFVDKRANQEVLANLDLVEERSSWSMEHVTIGAFYDFAKFKDCVRFLPKLSLYWDIPVDWLVSKRSAFTHGISLTLDLDF